MRCASFNKEMTGIFKILTCPKDFGLSEARILYYIGPKFHK